MHTALSALSSRIPLALGLSFLIISPADAYIDPGTGSYIFQIIVATLFGGLYALKLYWQQFKDFLTGRKKPDSTERPPQPDDHPSAKK
ncbi:MAG TPA: hypothetical protein VIV61_01200 [Candidatus Ozemobacteraceae bacterium]